MIHAMITARTESGVVKIPVDAYPIRNDFGLELAVYHLNRDTKNGRWVTFEQKTGLALHHAGTKKQAIALLLEWLGADGHADELRSMIDANAERVDKLIQQSMEAGKGSHS